MLSDLLLYLVKVLPNDSILINKILIVLLCKFIVLLVCRYVVSLDLLVVVDWWGCSMVNGGLLGKQFGLLLVWKGACVGQVAFCYHVLVVLFAWFLVAHLAQFHVLAYWLIPPNQVLHISLSFLDHSVFLFGQVETNFINLSLERISQLPGLMRPLLVLDLKRRTDKRDCLIGRPLNVLVQWPRYSHQAVSVFRFDNNSFPERFNEILELFSALVGELYCAVGLKLWVRIYVRWDVWRKEGRLKTIWGWGLLTWRILNYKPIAIYLWPKDSFF